MDMKILECIYDAWDIALAVAWGTGETDSDRRDREEANEWMKKYRDLYIEAERYLMAEEQRAGQP